MKIKALFFTLIAAVFSIVSCEELEGLTGLPSIELVGLESDVISFEADGGECQVALKANRKWTVNEDANWIEVDPKSGSASDEEQTVTIKVVKNENDDEDPTAGFDREAVIEFSVGAKTAYLTISQNGPQGSTDALIVYSNDFDKEKAEKVGDSGWTTYLDSFEGWKNETGTGLETVTYAYDRITARTNSSNGSAGGYSIYQGSGMNYLWLGSGKPYFSVKNITLPEGKVDFTISFGTERYLYEAPDNTFNWEEFKAYVSIDTVKWSLLPCEFAGESLPNGKWDLASATIRVPEGTKKLSLHFTSTMGSAYAIDDLKVEEALVEGTAIDFSAGVELTPDEGQQGGESDATAIYHNNYDKQEATKTYGSGQSYPYLDQFDGWMNAAGTGAANVSYAYTGMSVRSNSTSNSSYSDYAGSGLNNMFFGKSAYFSTNNIALNGAVNLTLTFGTEKYSQDNGSVFTNSEYHIWLSNDGKKWVELTDYTFAGGTKEGRWNVATANFSVPSGTETLSICMQVDVASSYRMDDLKLVASATAGTTVDFTQAVEKNFGEGGSTGGTDTPPSGQITDVTVAQFNDKAVSKTDLYRLTGIVGGPINTTYGNFDVIDETGKVYVYGISNWSDYKDKVAEGGNITVVGQRGEYNGKIEVLEGYIESYDTSEGGSGETPAPEVPDSVVKATVAQFLAAAEGETVYELSGTITRIGVAYDSEYNNISYYISDSTGETYIFRMSCEGVADPTSLTVGDEITVQGKRASYNTVPQMAAGSKYVSHVDKAAPAPEAGAHMLDFSVVANRTSFSTSEQVWEQNGVKVTNNKAGSTSNIADYSAPARFYKSTSLKIEKTGMKKIIFYCNSGKNTGPVDLQKSITDANVTVTVDGMNVTVTFANAVDVLEIASLAGQLRVDSLTVYTE